MSSIGVFRHLVLADKEEDVMRSMIVALLIALHFIPLYANDDIIYDGLIRDAENGDAEAQFNIGVCYYLGEGVVKNDKQAVYWFEKAANQGHAGAQFNIGRSYYHGEGVVKNYKQAVYWYEKAANQGIAGAQNNLGNCYGYGEGVVRNYQTAYFWYLLAAANGNELAKGNMDKIAKQLSSAQQSEIQARATRWFEEHQ
jgi:hypothetical protein